MEQSRLGCEGDGEEGLRSAQPRAGLLHPQHWLLSMASATSRDSLEMGGGWAGGCPVVTVMARPLGAF